MRSVFVCLFLLVAVGLAPARADDSAPSMAKTTAPVAEPRLDELFVQLKREHNEKAAARIAERIRQQWNKSGSATVDLMMLWSAEAIDRKKYAVALDFLDQVVTLAPGYAEGWNRRATVHALMNNYHKSMADIEKTLQFEPRHFGALSGMAQILSRTGRTDLALEAWRRVLDIYPMMRSAQSEMTAISEELAGQGI